MGRTKPAKINQPLVTPSKFYSDNLFYSNKPSAQSVAAGPVLRAVLAAPATGLALPAAAAAVLPAAAAALLALFAGLHGEEGLLAQLLLEGVGVDLLVLRRGLQWTNDWICQMAFHLDMA